MEPIQSAASPLISRKRTKPVGESSDLRRTRADIIKSVNLELLPLSHLIFQYCPIMGLILWLFVAVFPYLYIDSCENGMYMSSHIIYSLIAGMTFIFETRVARHIVNVIEPLSGKKRLSNFQTLRLIMGQLGRLDIYTNFCFVVICFECNSNYAFYALGIRLLSSVSLFLLQVKTVMERNVISLQLLEFTTLFDLLGKYQIMYVEGEKSSELMRAWVKTGSILPIFKFFIDDIGQFVIQLLFLIEQGQLKIFVCVSLCVGIVLSFLSVLMVYLKYKILTPNNFLEEELVQSVRMNLELRNFEAVKKALEDKQKFRKYASETRTEVLKLVTVTDFDLFVHLVDSLISLRNDALLHSEVFHEKLLLCLRKCRAAPDTLLRSITYMRDAKSVFINFNKQISISNEGTLLHCLMEEPHFLLRTLESREYDLVNFAIEQGAEVDGKDKFGETPTTLAARMNFEVLTRSSSSKTLRDLFDLYHIHMSKEEVDQRIKDWVYSLVLIFVTHGVDVTHRNKKGRNAVQIARQAGNAALAASLERLLRDSQGSISSI